MPKRLLVLLGCCLALGAAAAPRYAVREYSTHDGLSQRRVSDILQDRRGLMWLSTWNGLTCFDGASFISYTNATGSHGRLYNNRINFIRANSLGDIWCGTNDARAWLFDTYTERYLDILAPIEERLGRRFEVTLIFPLEKGVTWVLCEEGYALRMQDTLVKRGEGITLYSHRAGDLPGEDIRFVAQDDNGNEWILTDGGVVMAGDRKPVTTFDAIYFAQNEAFDLFTSSNKVCLLHKQSASSRSIELQGINGVIPLGENFALATDYGVVVCDPASGALKRYDIRSSGIASGEVAELYADSQGGLWAITPRQGIVRIDLRSGACRYVLAHREPITSTFPPYSVWEDPYGTVWVIPLVGPIRYWDPAGEVLRFAGGDQPAHSSFVGRYYPDAQGNLWIAHSNGLSHLSFSKDYARYIPEDKDYETRALMVDSRGDTWSGSKSGVVRRYDSRSGALHYLSSSGKPSASFSKLTSVGTGIYALMEDSAGNLYIGTRGDGLYILTPQGHMAHYRHDGADPYSLSSNDIYSICEDARGRIWVGCFSGGINLLRSRDAGPVRFINVRNRLRHYPVERFGAVRHITQGPDGVMLVGTTQGLLAFDGRSDDYENLRFHTTVHSLEREGLAGVNVMHILPTRRGELFVMSFDGSIQQIVGTDLLSDTLRFRSYRTPHDRTIPELALAAIEDRDGQMWVVSEDALTRFDAARERFEPLHADLLVPGNYFTEAIPALARNGELLIGTYGGILAFDPRRMIRRDEVPPIVFTEITLQGRGEARKVYRCERLRVTPDARNLQIGFTTLDYLDAASIQYAYRLEGLESEWNYTLENRAVSYVNLPPGRYRFEVRSTDSRGVWVDNTLSLPIEVMPRFGETVWAWLLYGLATGCLIALVAYTIFYVYRLRSRSQMERRMADIKLRFFTDISHELRTPLTLIASPVSEVLEGEALSSTAREHLGVVKRNVERMLLLINQILDFRKIQNKKMRLLVEHVDLVAQARSVMAQFELVAHEKRIDFRLEHDPPTVMCWVDRDKFEKILFNLLSNAFKFTPAGRSIVVRVARGMGQAVVSVIDTGVGIPASKLARLFERFETVSAYDSLQPSSGIGLSMVRELVLLHHGRVEVFSRQGEQTELRVTLPGGRAHFEKEASVEFIVSDASPAADESAPAPVTAPAAAEQPAPDPRAVTLLIVEDNPELAAFLAGVLRRDYRVLTASNGLEGLEVAAREQPDFILTDVMMPRMDGLEMIRAIKLNAELCHIPIVVLSARSELDERIHALETGIDDYITKPFSVSYLRTRVATLIESRRRMQEQMLASLSEGASAGLSPAKPLVVPFDRHFMEQLMAFMEQQMDNADLTVDDLAAAGEVSRTILYRKLRTIVGLSPIDFIRKIRIERAKQLIDTGEFTFSQTAYMSGFGDPKYFSKCFKKETGLTPSEYKSKRKEA